MKRKEINVVIEELKERLTAKKMTKQYGDGCKKFRKTNYFRINKNDCLKNYRKKCKSQSSQLQKKK